MLAVSAVLVAFLLVGLTVIGAGFASRRRKADAGAPPKNGLLYTGLALVTVVIGLGIPALILVNNGTEGDKQAVGGVDLSSAQVTGRELFAANCATCHTLQASNATGAIGPNLDAMKPGAALVENAVLIGRAAGNGNMPAGLLTGDDAKDVASYVAAVAGHGEGVVTQAGGGSTSGGTSGGSTAGGSTSGGGTTADALGKQVFTQNCGSCHTLKAAGTTGTVGPNLDDAKPAAALVVTRVTNGQGAMPAFKGQLTPAQIAAVAKFVSSSAGK